MPLIPDFDRMALLLDIDGTLLEFAAAPMLVTVPASLIDELGQLRQRLGGALGLITGRPIDQVDRLFPDLPTAIAGEHGAALRHGPALPVLRSDLPTMPQDWRMRASALVTAHPGALFEPKPAGFVLHFRNAPDAGPALYAGLEQLIGQADGFQIMPAKMAWECKPRGIDKGAALRALMRQPPFAGRLPVFIGDDITDQDAIAAADALGGQGYLVGDSFGTPEAVRTWLGLLSRTTAPLPPPLSAMPKQG